MKSIKILICKLAIFGLKLFMADKWGEKMNKFFRNDDASVAYLTAALFFSLLFSSVVLAYFKNLKMFLINIDCFMISFFFF